MQGSRCSPHKWAVYGMEVEMNFFLPECFLNLGRVYLMLRDKEGAHAAFSEGLRFDPGYAPLKAELRKMGKRRAQTFGFLPRGHFLNRVAGKWRKTLTKK